MDNKYFVNDYVSYGLTGICLVTAINPLSSKEPTPYYHLSPLLDEKSTAYVPVSLQDTHLRDIFSETEIKHNMDSFSELASIDFANEKVVEITYKKEMQKYSCESWFRVIKTAKERITKSQSANKKSAVDDRILKSTFGLLCKEISISLKRPFNETEDMIESLFA